MSKPDDSASDPSVGGAKIEYSKTPDGQHSVESVQFTFIDSSESESVESLSGDTPDSPIERIGRYRFEATLGQGGFGRVYLAFDEELERYVAVKVPAPNRMNARMVKRFVAEARTVAQLQHPGIVPVYDVGSTESGLCYVVSRFIDGQDLLQRIQVNRFSAVESAALVEKVARALNYVHLQGIVHRDIKPANILLSKDDDVFVADFGLAMRDYEYGTGKGLLGTPNYMSPEQARGEGHLVDGRADIYSLGVVLYVMLTNKLPFEGKMPGLLDQIQHGEPRLPRQINSQIPAELERICMKAMAKWSIHRYPTAEDFADDLRDSFRDPLATGGQIILSAPSTSEFEHGSTHSRIIPRGLQSFQGQDSEFFLSLLPGPRDRKGVPESINFWKQKIETSDVDDAFRIGLLYGPSGCGKSSFVKAGLLPLLDRSINTIFIEATENDTESRLLSRLQRSSVDLPEDIGLRDTFKQLRLRGESGHRTLIVIDQFEQWLHAETDPENSQLARALRQCDGISLQCVLLVRDDFWLACYRFMACLEVELAQNRNMRLVDLFDDRHARYVLREFGRAFDRLPGLLDDLSPSQDEFIDTAIAGLKEQQYVIPVRLALFAEMMKTREWTPQSLEQLGGIGGVGIQFLEDSFESQAAAVERVVHQSAALQTLNMLVPDAGTDIKGSMTPHDELLRASGYKDQPDRFRSLLTILETDLKLITPTDPSGRDDTNAVSETSGASGAGRYYQLTHDFLVPAIREWVDRKSNSTKRGRAIQDLKNIESVWAARRESKYLPSLSEWVGIRRHVGRSQWTKNQSQMMASAAWRFVRTGLIATTVIAVLGFGGWQIRQLSTDANLVNQMSTASPEEAGDIIDRLVSRGDGSVDELRALSNAETTPMARMFANVALLDHDVEALPQLQESLLSTPDIVIHQFLVKRLVSRSPELTPILWKVLNNKAASEGNLETIDQRRFNAGLALAQFDPPTDKASLARWNAEHIREFMTAQLLTRAIQRNSYLQIVRATSSLRNLLASGIAVAAFAQPTDVDFDPLRSESGQQLLSDWFRVEPVSLADVFLAGSVDQVMNEIKLIDENRVAIDQRLLQVIHEPLEGMQDGSHVDAARRIAMAGGILVRHQHGEPLNLLQDSAWPDVRSYMIGNLMSLGADAEFLHDQLQGESSASIRSGIYQAVGEARDGSVNAIARAAFVGSAKDDFRNSNDVGLNASARWLLDRWGEKEWVNDTLSAIGPDENQDHPFSMTSVGHVMVPVSGIRPGLEFSATEVTLEQFQAYAPGVGYEPDRVAGTDSPLISVSWYDAVRYCQWLTKNEGLGDDDLCYEETEVGEFLLVNDYEIRKGYRLPTPEEWNVAATDNKRTRFSFGHRWELAPLFGIVDAGKIPAATSGRPSVNGLFGVHGGVGEWCSRPVENGDDRDVRGTHFQTDVSPDKSTLRLIVENYSLGALAATSQYRSFGFRIVRAR